MGREQERFQKSGRNFGFNARGGKGDHFNFTKRQMLLIAGFMGFLGDLVDTKIRTIFKVVLIRAFTLKTIRLFDARA